MEIFNKIIKLIDINLISCLFPLVLTLIIVKLIFKNRLKIKPILNLIRWIIISYTIIALMHFLIGTILSPDKSAFINRATGPYKWAYWLMFLSATIFPLSLFYKKLASKPIYLLVVALFMKIGWYFELFVIAITSYHRDYVPEGKINWIMPKGIQMTFLQGFILAIILLGLFGLIEQKKTKHKRNL